MLYLTVSFLSFIFTVFLTQYLIEYLNSKGIVDNPNGEKRRVHSEPVPRLGGIVIFIVVLGISLIFYQDVWSKYLFIAGAAIAFGLGLWDDFNSVKWYIKFLFQFAAATLLILSLQDHNFTIVNCCGFTLPPVLNFIILLGLIVGIMNAFNMLDGLDGLVTGLALIIAGMCFLLSFSTSGTFPAILSASLVGTSLGFLKFNASPARIFLGDSGSLTIGYLIISLLLLISNHTKITSGTESTIDLLFIIIVLAVPITDTLRVMFVRLKNRKHPFLPDSSHIHHIIYSKKIRHKTVVLLINGYSAIFALIGIYYMYSSKIVGFIIFVVMLIILLYNEKLIELVIRKENLLKFGRRYKKIPTIITVLYKKMILPVVTLFIIALILFLIFKEIDKKQSYYIYFLLFLIPSFIYASLTLKNNHYYVDILVFLNIIIFLIITGLNGFFYKMYPVPVLAQININQIFIILLSTVVIFFILFKERVANIQSQFLNSVDLSIALSIGFIFITVHFIDLQTTYIISDTLLKSFLLFLYYKIIITTYPRFHFSLHYTSFVITFIAMIKSLF